MRLDFDIKDFKPVDSNIIVIPGPIKKIKTLDIKPVEATTKQNIDKIKEVTKSYISAPTDLRIGIVAAIADNLKEVGFNVGDSVVYKYNRGMHQKLDLVAKKSDDDTCPILMRSYEVLAIINK